MERMDNLYLAIKLYHSDNHLGFNSMVKVLKDPRGKREILGVLYLSFDHHFPRFIWERSKLSMRQREYLELKAQVEVERHIAAIMEKQDLGF